MILCAFKLGFLQLICKTSLIFKSNLEVALSTILKQRELYESKNVAVECRCLTIWEKYNLLLSVFVCFSFVVFYISLSSIVLIISMLIIGIFYCLNYTLRLLHLFITHLVIDFIITMQLTYVLGNYYDLYKYH